MERLVQTGVVVKPIRDWQGVVHEAGKKVVARHWRNDFKTCTVENKDGSCCRVSVSIYDVKLDDPPKTKKKKQLELF